MSDAFTHDKLRWLDQVAADVDISPFTFKLAFILSSRFLNRETGTAWPTQAALAATLRVTTRGVQKAIDALEGGGHLTVVAARGRGCVNRYRPVMLDAGPEAVSSEDMQAVDNANPGSHQTSENTNGCSHQPAKIRTAVRVIEPVKYERSFAQNPLNIDRQKESKAEIHIDLSAPVSSHLPHSDLVSGSTKSKLSSKALDAEFEDWWKAYPRKKAKGKAQPLFARLRRAGTELETLHRGALRYAAEVDGKDPRYVKHPTTWLNGRCWEDEPDTVLEIGGVQCMSDMNDMAGGRSDQPRASQIIEFGEHRQRRATPAGLTGGASALAGILSGMGGRHGE